MKGNPSALPLPGLAQIRREAAAQAAAQAAAVEADRRRAAEEAAKYERKQKQLEAGGGAGPLLDARPHTRMRKPQWCAHAGPGSTRSQCGSPTRRQPPAHQTSRKHCPNPQERLAAKALEGEQLAAAKEALRARLRAMEGKIIKASGFGGGGGLCFLSWSAPRGAGIGGRTRALLLLPNQCLETSGGAAQAAGAAPHAGTRAAASTRPAPRALQGEARGGLLEVTRRKEEEISKREAQLARRCARGDGRTPAEGCVFGPVPDCRCRI